jgi:hypothetical protein
MAQVRCTAVTCINNREMLCCASEISLEDKDYEDGTDDLVCMSYIVNVRWRPE